MIKLTDSVLILYIVSSLLGFSLRFFKDASWKELSTEFFARRMITFGFVLLPCIVLFLVGQQFGVAAGTTLPYFLGPALLFCVLSAINLPSYLRGLVLLGASVVLTLCFPASENLIAITSALLGLLVVKLADNLVFADHSNTSLDDVLPPFIWLTGAAWISSAESGNWVQLKASLLLGIMSVSILMRFVQGPFVSLNKADDKIYLKRVVLSITAGLAVLCIIVKLLNAMDMQSLAAICGAGYFVTYLFKNLNGERRYALDGQQSIRLVILIGLLTLVATRLYGSFGLLALAPAAMVAPVSSVAILPGLFFASRVLLQVFIQNFNLNVTGINLTHAYAGAAMYAGFMLAVVCLLLFREISDRRILLAVMLGLGVGTPILSNYLLHAEPTCSLFVSLLTGATLLVIVWPALENKPTLGVENLMLLPSLMLSSGILTHGLLEAGAESTIAAKTSVIGYTMVVVLAFILVLWWLFRNRAKKVAAGN